MQMNRLVKLLRNTRSYSQADGDVKPKKSRRSSLAADTLSAGLDTDTPPHTVGGKQRKSSWMRMSTGSVDPFSDGAREEADDSAAENSPRMPRTRWHSAAAGVTITAHDTDTEAELRDKTREMFDSLRVSCPGREEAVPIDTIQSAMLNAECPFTQQELNVLFQGT